MNEPPRPIQRIASVVGNRPIARDTFEMRFSEPEIAARILPGQFVMIRAAGRLDPLLARPYALYDVHGRPDAPEEVAVVYLVVGNGTRCLSRLSPGERLDVWGPLGNTFPTDAAAEGRLLLLAGGVGQTPFLAVAKELLGRRRYGGGRAVATPRRITLGYGARSRDLLAGVEDFTREGVEVLLATNDGSAGERGYATVLLDRVIESDDPPAAIFSCGPEPMLERVARRAAEAGVPCWVSLETKMACGYGVCFSCVAPVLEGEGWDYRRVCLDGPVFAGERIAWRV